MKNLIILFTLLYFFINLNCALANEICVETTALTNKEIRAQLNKIKTKRIIIANALLLDDAQKKKANTIYSKIIQKEALQLAQLRKEQEILKSMTKENSTSEARRKQRKIVYNLQEAIRISEKQVDKEFKKILTHNQKVKFKRLKKEINISNF